MKIWLCIFFFLFNLDDLHGADENWLSLSVRKDLSSGHFILAEFVRRDEGFVFTDKVRDLYRITYGIKHDNLSFLLGGVLAFSDTSSVEYRTFQQGILNLKNSQFDSSGLIRVTVEERRFVSDSHIYARLRMKFVLMPLSSWQVGPAFYNETFFGFLGAERFKDGYNENRFGYGVRFSAWEFEGAVFGVLTDAVSLSGRHSEANWLQFLLSKNF